MKRVAILHIFEAASNEQQAAGRQYGLCMSTLKIDPHEGIMLCALGRKRNLYIVTYIRC
jgi:hypothetical protein